MHKMILVVLGLTFTLAYPAIGQAPAPSAPAVAPAETKTANELTLQAVTQFKSVFKAASSAVDDASATIAVNKINAATEKAMALQPLLAKASKPTALEMKAMAVELAKLESQMFKDMQTMALNLKAGGPAVASKVDAAMSRFTTKTAALTKTLEVLYPKDKMRPLIAAEIKKAKAKKANVPLTK